MPGTKALKSAAMGPVSEEMAPITMSDLEPDPPEVVAVVAVVVVVLLAAPGLELEQPARRAAAKSTAVTVPANREVVLVWSRMLPRFPGLCAHMAPASTIMPSISFLPLFRNRLLLHLTSEQVLRYRD